MANNGPDHVLPGQLALPIGAAAAPPPPPPLVVAGPPTDEPPRPSSTLEYTKRWLQERIDEGVACPCCEQFAKIYKRPMTGTMAHALILIYRHFLDRNVGEWLHVPTYLTAMSGLGPMARGGDWAKLVHWGLILEKGDVRDDGSNRAGYYKITDEGRQFVECRIKVFKYVWIYNGVAFARDMDCPLVSIRDVLGTRFDYAELMKPA